MTSTEGGIALLKCRVQQYAWGKLGLQSAVARLSGNDVDESAPYAELWMGTHPNGPSDVVLSANASASSVVTLPLKEYLGGKDLPYLFKVLSVNKALSIQAHPDKTLAEKLHHDRPNVYKDPNHKPEMALAVTTFEAMCGFRPPKQIVEFLQTVPEFRSLVGEDIASAFERCTSAENDPKPALRALFTALMTAEHSQVKEHVDALITRVSSSGELSTNAEPIDMNELLVRLSQQFPGDVGIFCPFVLNLLRIEPGDAIFLAANEPHAYLDGDIIECMACSDNVVRAGLTPKLRDVDTLCNMLTYTAMLPKVFSGDSVDAFTKVYTPPIDEFRISRTSLVSSSGAYQLEPVNGAAILLCYSGKGTIQCSSTSTSLPLSTGSIVVIDDNHSTILEAEGTEELLLFRCSINA